MRRISVLASLVLGALAIAGCGGGDTTPTTPTGVTTTPEAEVVRPPQSDFVVIVVKKTISGGGRKTVKLGKTVRIQVIADARDEVHLHGYDKKVKVAPGKPGNLTFVANTPGIFEVELESKGLKLLDLVIK